MARLGGIDVAWVTLTWLDGSQETYREVEYLRQTEGVTLVLPAREMLSVPWTALRHVRYGLTA